MRLRHLLPLALLLVSAGSARAGSFRRQCDAWWSFRLDGSSHGYALELVPGGKPQVAADWTKPDAPGLFAVGVSTYDPPPPKGDRRARWFGPLGNIYNRPQREISLHWNGREIANRVCSAALVTPRPQSAHLRIEFRAGGAYVSVVIGGADAVYNRYFVPELTPYAWQAAFHNLTPSHVRTRLSGGSFRMRPPIRVQAIDRAFLNPQVTSASNTVTFPPAVGIGRVICTLRLDPGPKGFDAWDRIGQIMVSGDDGKPIEIYRYITPYGTPWQWKMDMTDYLPILTGKRTVTVDSGTYSQGWDVSVRFDFFTGRRKLVPYRVVSLWSGSFPAGDWEKPMDAYLPPVRVPTDAFTAAAKLRLSQTGHGQNEDNLGEFAPLWREVICNGRRWRNTLWTTDNYLNPDRPQMGTWKFDRAGWGPGTVDPPWSIDLTPVLEPGNALLLAYHLQPYRKKTLTSQPANEVLSAQVILYRRGG
ncbi:MAG: hypothetical protein KGJ62_00215 [Armatimonadetes bacterium]|nr:hypothetical protein [Armatimonadota bacterium]MDE2206047.1 hypothetical protein [Armatimonadota bacterium]